MLYVWLLEKLASLMNYWHNCTIKQALGLYLGSGSLTGHLLVFLGTERSHEMGWCSAPHHVKLQRKDLLQLETLGNGMGAVANQPSDLTMY